MTTRSLGRFETAATLTDAAAAPLRNIVKDIAAALCRCLAITEGTWAIAIVDSAKAEDGSKFRFDEVARPLKQEFVKRGITPTDVIRVTEHREGYCPRNAIDNIAIGLMEPKFAGAQFYCALEALRTSMAPRANKRQRWDRFRAEFQVTQTQIEGLILDQALRHGDYGNATPISAAEMGAAVSFLGEIVCKYVAWFKDTKLSAPAGFHPTIA